MAKDSEQCNLSSRMARFGKLKILAGEPEDKAVVYQPSDESSDRQPYPEIVPTAAEVWQCILLDLTSKSNLHGLQDFNYGFHPHMLWQRYSIH